MKKTFILMAATVMLMCSCNTEKFQDGYVEQAYHLNDNALNNPLDIIGIEHNAIIEKYIDNFKIGDEYNIVKGEYHNIVNSLKNGEGSNIDTLLLILDKYTDFTYEASIKAFVRDGLISSGQKSVFDEFYNLMKNNASQEQVMLKIAEINALNQNFPATDKEVVFAFTSTLRHSYVLWSNKSLDNGAKLPWWQVVLADAVGAAVGTGLAGPAGGVLLGVAASFRACSL